MRTRGLEVLEQGRQRPGRRDRRHRRGDQSERRSLLGGYLGLLSPPPVAQVREPAGLTGSPSRLSQHRGPGSRQPGPTGSSTGPSSLPATPASTTPLAADPAAELIGLARTSGAGQGFSREHHRRGGPGQRGHRGRAAVGQHLLRERTRPPYGADRASSSQASADYAPPGPRRSAHGVAVTLVQLMPSRRHEPPGPARRPAGSSRNPPAARPRPRPARRWAVKGGSRKLTPRSTLSAAAAQVARKSAPDRRRSRIKVRNRVAAAVAAWAAGRQRPVTA